MKQYLNNFTLSLIIFFLIIIASLQIHYQNSLQQRKEEMRYILLQKEDKNIQHELTMQMLYVVFLLHGEEDTLQKLLIESSKDILIWMESENKNDQDFIVMCDFWNNDEMHKVLQNTSDAKFDKVRTRLDGLCRSKDSIEYTK
jgi:hypothetical protein